MDHLTEVMNRLMDELNFKIEACHLSIEELCMLAHAIADMHRSMLHNAEEASKVDAADSREGQTALKFLGLALAKTIANQSSADEEESE